jgi:hypothetical protein
VHGKGHPRLNPPFISASFRVAEFFFSVPFIIFRYQRFTAVYEMLQNAVS